MAAAAWSNLGQRKRLLLLLGAVVIAVLAAGAVAMAVVRRSDQPARVGDVFGGGSRMLVSADGDGLPRPTAWVCGFTRWYTEADARVWRGAFGR